MTNAATRMLRPLLPVAVVAIGAGVGAGLAGTANAAAATSTVRVSATDDAYTSSDRPSYVFGAADTLYAGTVKGDTMVSYLKFTVPAGDVTAARVTLTRDAHPFAGGALKLSKVATTPWTEKTLSAKSHPALGATVVSVTPKAADPTVSFDVSSVVTGAGTYTFAVSGPSAKDAAHFRSDEATTGKPVLTLTLAPTTPATAPTTAPTVTPTTPGTAPTTPDAATPTTPGTAPAAPARCTVDAKLVPSCGVLWGAAAGGFSTTPRDQALTTFEHKTGRTATIFHLYHKGDEQFPTPTEIAMTTNPTTPRTLMENWKIAYGTTWANVAAGHQDTRIDTEATYLKTHYTTPFFLVLHHEPENDVNPNPTSGMTATDYANMYRHTIQRLRTDGVTNAISTIAYMNYEKWNNTTWWPHLYPGDDVIDWIGVDSYLNAQPGGFHNGDFTSLMNRTQPGKPFPGFYTWATTQHPTKPIMVAEWGVYDASTTINGQNKANIYNTVLHDLTTMPAIKGLLYFETAKDQSGHDIRIDDTPQALTAFHQLATNPLFNITLH